MGLLSTEILDEVKTAATYGKGYALAVPRRQLPVHKVDELLEVTIARASAPGQEFRLFLMRGWTTRRVFLSLAQVEPRRGEPFLMKSIKRYGFEEFAEDYNANKPRGPDNVRLSENNGGISMTLDEFSFQLQRPKLRTTRGAAILESSLPRQEGEITISKKLDGFTMGLKDEERSPITSITWGGDLLVLTYYTNHAPFPHERRINTHRWHPETDEVPNARGNAQAKLETQQADSLMTVGEMRGWIDGEGNITSVSPSKGGPHIAVSQKERAPLQVMSETLSKMAIGSKVYYSKSNDSYVLMVLGWENVARVIAEVGPFRTTNRMSQVEEFKRKLALPRKKTHSSTMRARIIMGLS